MAGSDNINVPGYVQKIVYSDNIEYRNFSPDLIGNLPFNGDNNNSSLFTYGNFALTTNTSGKRNIYYPTKAFSNFYTLNDLTQTPNGTSITSSNVTTTIGNNAKVVLNLDNTKLPSFAYFGSATEFIRVTLESIITKWPASLFFTFYDYQTSNLKPTIVSYEYNQYFNTTTIILDTNTLYNPYEIIYTQSGSLLVNHIENPLRNFTVNYRKFNFLLDGVEYPLIGIVPPTDDRGSQLSITVTGDVFDGIDISINSNGYKELHIKPNSTEVEYFFQNLEPFENNLLNRLTIPKYTAVFDYKFITDTGIIYDTSKSVTWPTSDGYNIDFDTNEYVTYVTQLIDICTVEDRTISDLMFRFLTSESISNFDTVPRCDGTEEETAGQKMTKTLRIYGREFDEVKKYIDGIAYANNVSYDKKDNTPDQVVKYLARTLGWQLTSSLVENDIIKSYLHAPASTYSGQSRGLTAAEAEIELWRRLILNSAWLFKSKGTRKAIEFLFKFIGAPQGLIDLNEYVYVATSKIDVELLTNTLVAFGLSTDLDNYPIDSDGYPRFFADNPLMYFQKGGLWYKETGGLDATDFNLIGNNPHIGPYDGGAAYINQLRNIIPDYKPITITSTTYTNVTNQLFTNYNNGLVNTYTGDTYVDVETWSGVSLSDCFLYDAYVITDPKPTYEQTECGCYLPAEDLSLYIDVVRDEYTFNEQLADCESRISGYTLVSLGNELYYSNPKIYMWNYYTYNPDGTQTNVPYTTPFVSKTCCNALVGGYSYLYDQYSVSDATGLPTLVNSGYVCCSDLPQRPGTGPLPGVKPKPFTDFGFERRDKYESKTPFGGFETGFASKVKGPKCGCYLGCQWRLAGPLLGQMYTLGSDKFLKFVTPKNNWGQNGTPEYRVTTEADGCICPLKFTTPVQITDPYTNKLGFGCKINKQGAEILSLKPTNPSYGTTNSTLYQLFYQKSVGDISCTSDVPVITCNIKLGTLEKLILLENNNFQAEPLPTIVNATSPKAYLWEITQQTGGFSQYGILNGNNGTTAQIGKITPGQGDKPRGVLTLKLTVTDAKGCKASTSVTFSNAG